MNSAGESDHMVRDASYVHRKQEWRGRHGGHSPIERRWRNFAVLFLITTILATGGLVTLGTLLLFGVRKEIVPYVVQVDKTGAVTAIEPAERLTIPDNAIIAAQLTRWIRAVRTVYGDAAAQRALIGEAYAMLDRNSDAYAELNEHMRQSNPFLRAADENVSVDVQSVLPMEGPKWRIEWREETRGRDAALKSNLRYQAVVAIGFAQPRDEPTIRANPIGLYVGSFHWGRL
jgi:type IV secretion system protein TrbF